MTSIQTNRVKSTSVKNNQTLPYAGDTTQDDSYLTVVPRVLTDAARPLSNAVPMAVNILGGWAADRYLMHKVGPIVGYNALARFFMSLPGFFADRNPLVQTLGLTAGIAAPVAEMPVSLGTMAGSLGVNYVARRAIEASDMSEGRKSFLGGMVAALCVAIGVTAGAYGDKALNTNPLVGGLAPAIFGSEATPALPPPLPVVTQAPLPSAPVHFKPVGYTERAAVVGNVIVGVDSGEVKNLMGATIADTNGMGVCVTRTWSEVFRRNDYLLDNDFTAVRLSLTALSITDQLANTANGKLQQVQALSAHNAQNYPGTYLITVLAQDPTYDSGGFPSTQSIPQIVALAQAVAGQNNTWVQLAPGYSGTMTPDRAAVYAAILQQARAVAPSTVFLLPGFGDTGTNLTANFTLPQMDMTNVAAAQEFYTPNYASYLDSTRATVITGVAPIGGMSVADVAKLRATTGANVTSIVSTFDENPLPGTAIFNQPTTGVCNVGAPFVYTGWGDFCMGNQAYVAKVNGQA